MVGLAVGPVVRVRGLAVGLGCRRNLRLSPQHCHLADFAQCSLQDMVQYGFLLNKGYYDPRLQWSQPCCFQSGQQAGKAWVSGAHCSTSVMSSVGKQQCHLQDVNQKFLLHERHAYNAKHTEGHR